MNNREQKILDIAKKLGQTPEQAMKDWLRVTVLQDYFLWQTLENKFGAKQALDYYMKIWEDIFASYLSKIKKSQKIDKINIEELGKLSKIYWEGIFISPYKTIEENDEIHIGQMSNSPFWDDLFKIFGEKVAIDFCNKTFPALINSFQSILKKLNVWDIYYLTIDNWLYLGDDYSRLIINKRQKNKKGD